VPSAALATKENPMIPWTWPEGRFLMLYHWSWMDTSQRELVHGWSHMGAVDDAGFIHLEAELWQEPTSMWVDPDGNPIVKLHTFGSVAALPSELCDDDHPLLWVRLLIETGR
jgi:hypothetical protein